MRKYRILKLSRRARLGLAFLFVGAFSNLGHSESVLISTSSIDVSRIPKVGLVLSGGGARGAAHIGVLKVMEEMRIPIGFIVGTSMGSGVGGLYSTGLMADDVAAIFSEFNWIDAFRDSPGREALSFRRKEDDRTFLVRARIGVGKKGVKLSKGFAEGQNFVTELRRLSGVTEPISSFDLLPIPFRAVAADLNAAEMVVLDKGDLVKAVRASVAIPPLLTPIELDGRLLVDGGYLRNLPVDVAQTMGPNPLVVINIGTPLLEKENINSVVDVFGQVGRLGGNIQDRRQVENMGPDDLLIRPDLGDLSFSDFNRIPELIDRGEKAAEELRDQLKAYSVTEAEYKAWRASLRPRPTFPLINGIEFRNDTKFPDYFIKTFIRQKIGEPLDPVMIKEDLGRLYGLGYFEWLDYHVEPREGNNILVIESPPRSWGPNYLRLGLRINESFDGNSTYGILARYQMTEINRLGAEFLVDGEIGTNSRIGLEYYQPVGRVPSRFSYGVPYFVFINGTYGWQHDPLLLLEKSLFPFEVRDFGGNIGAGRTIGKMARFKVGMGIKDEKWETPTLPDFTIRQKIGDLFARIELDTLDKASFPRNGWLVKAEYRDASETLGSDNDGAKAEGYLGGAVSLGPHTVRIKGIYNTNLEETTDEIYYFRSGGFMNLSGYPNDVLLGNHEALSQIQYLYQAGRVLGMPWYVGTMGEWGGVWSDRSDISLDSGVWTGSVLTALDSGLGPVFLAYTLTDNSRESVTLTMGMPF